MKILKKIPSPLSFLTFYLIITFSCSTDQQTTINDKEAADTNIVKDIDGNIYHVIKIGNQVWLKENLKVTHFRNGDPLPNITNDNEWAADTIGAYCNYNNDTAIAAVYGRLYNWYVVNDIRGICPEGWHVPSSDEFSDLDYMFGGPLESGKYLKEAGTSHWEKPNDAINISLFSALPGGHREGGFSRLGLYAFFWNCNEYIGDACITDKENGCAHECSFNYLLSYFNQDWGFKSRGMSVRCIKDTIKVD